MLNINDFKEKKIVFISKFGGEVNDLKFWNSNIRLYKDGVFVNQVSCYLVNAIFIVGEFTITSVLIRKLQKFGISLFLLNSSFECYADIMSKAEGNYLLREKQYKLSKETALQFAKEILKNKIENQSNLLKEYKNPQSKTEIEKIYLRIDNYSDWHKLLGLEGKFADVYFRQIFKDLGWYRRAPRTKEDINNLLLDIGYTFLFNYVDSILKLFGFDTYKGFYHQLFFQRKSLSCDVMEPLRVIVDKELVKSFNLGMIDEKDFIFKNGSFMFKNYKVQKKYIYIWFDLIMKNKLEIYKYILGLYRHYLDKEKYPYVKFKL